MIFLIIIFLSINSFTILYFDSLIIQVITTLLLSIALTLTLLKFQRKTALKGIMKYLGDINKIDFKLPDIVDISDEERERIHNIAKQIKTNLKTQVEISTEIFNECERLNKLSIESLSSAEFIASSVEIADLNTSSQNDMLNEANDLTNKINKSMYDIEKDIVEKIQFIGSSITTAQREIETINDIEIRMNNAKDMFKETTGKMVQLNNYSDEVGILVDLINSISKETKMLSLNASIEAARAGEDGKGFSIVAMEVGKLAAETDEVSKKIEEVMNVLKDEIGNITKSMNKEMSYMDENCKVVEDTNKELITIVQTLNLGKESLEEIKNVTGKNNEMIEDVTLNIHKIAEFSEETKLQMAQTSNQTSDQHIRAKELNEVVDTIRENVYSMQQFVAGKVMEEKMLKQAQIVKDYFVKNTNISDGQINNLLKEVGIDAIYITDSSGIVEYTNEKSAIGLNLYIADPTFAQFKEEKKEFIVTPIKKRVEDGKLFKFLTLTDDDGKLYEIGLALDSLIKTV